MKKVLATVFLSLLFCNIGFAESYYFKKCQLSEIVYGDYVIDFDQNVIKVSLKTIDGAVQELTDKIKLITKDKIVSEKIQSKTGKNYYFQYYLDANSKSITKQNYKKESDFFKLDGLIRQSFCANVKADWDKVKKKEVEKKQTELEVVEEKKRKKMQIELIRKKEKIRKEEEEKRKEEKNRHRISINGKKWISISKWNTASGLKSQEQLKNDFDKRASELCSLTGNFDILEKKIEVIDLDDSPAFGLETAIKLGIVGVVKCK